MAKLEIWNEKEAKSNLSERLRGAIDDRSVLENRWQNNERVVYTTAGNTNSNNVSMAVEDVYTSGISGVNQSDETVGINYSAKNLRFIHAQLSANPPTVLPRPTSNDPDDRRKADAADRLVRYALRQYNMQEIQDNCSNNTLLYGTGFTKTIWDTEAGDPLDMDEEGNYTMEGEFSITVPTPWDVYLDPDASCWTEVKFIFEKVMVPWEEAKYKFPDKIKIMQQSRLRQGSHTDNDYSPSNANQSLIKNKRYDVVELYEYWEKGSAVNGFVGRFCICTKNGDLITELMENPEQYSAPRKSRTAPKPLPVAHLPYQIFTDIDAHNQVWGKSFLEYTIAIQDNLNRIDNVALENFQAHGVARLILPEGTEVSDDSITNSPWDIIKITGTQPPHFMEPMPMPQMTTQLMERYRNGIDDMSGVNESMFGQQSRETSGFSMQYATNQGNMIRRRLFNKYVLFVESVYKSYLRIVQKHWELSRTISVLGKEKAFESMDIKGADIDGGFDIVVEYGASLSLDPTTRREEILTYMPLFEKAGVESRKIMEMLKLNELAGLHDTLERPKDRQQEDFEEMIASGMYIPPEELQNHKARLTYAYDYLESSEFKYLTEDEKSLIRRQVREREELAAQGATSQFPVSGNQPPGPAPAGLAPGGALPPLPGPKI